MSPSDVYDIFTNVGYDAVVAARKAWVSSHAANVSGSQGLLSQFLSDEDDKFVSYVLIAAGIAFSLLYLFARYKQL